MAQSVVATPEKTLPDPKHFTVRPLAHIKKPLYNPFHTSLAPPFGANKPCYDDSLDSELSSFEDEHMS